MIMRAISKGVPSKTAYDAVVVGSGPNGFAAAITLAQKGLSVVLLEGHAMVGGGMRSGELTLPGFIHDICSAIHPLGIGSPFFRSLPLHEHGLEWIFPGAPCAHPLDNGDVVILEKSLADTCASLGVDGNAYRALLQPYVGHWDSLAHDFLAPPFHWPKHPVLLGQFGLHGLRSAQGLADSLFKETRARALFAGLSAHSMLPLEKSLSAAFGMILGIIGHAIGWPMPRGGAQSLANALASYLLSLGGEIVTEFQVDSLDALPKANITLLDVAPKGLLKIGGDHLSDCYRSALKKYRYGPGIFKVDWALSNPIPWTNKECLRAGTVHVGGTLEEIATSERLVWEGKHPERSYIILAQQSLFDPSRAPSGQHTGWGYCHVPNGSTVDMTDRIEAQIERFAPGFRDSILARSTRTSMDLERYNPNNVGGDINGGVEDLRQFLGRPVLRINPYATSVKGLYLCSASTPPGGGVHGMCGYHAAREALRHCSR